MKQMASAEALKQVKLVASELRASPPKNEASGFGASRFQAEARLNHPRLAIKSLGFRVKIVLARNTPTHEASEAGKPGA